MKVGVDQILKNQARKAMLASSKRMSDLIFFESLLKRVNAGEDLSLELPALKQLSPSETVLCVEGLINRCNDDLLQGYWVFNSKNITTKVDAEIIRGELVPRYKVEYKIQILEGFVIAKVIAEGVNISIEIFTKNIPKDVGLDKASNELLMAVMRS
jgi:hypothetical protein